MHSRVSFLFGFLHTQNYQFLASTKLILSLPDFLSKTPFLKRVWYFMLHTYKLPGWKTLVHLVPVCGSYLESSRLLIRVINFSDFFQTLVSHIFSYRDFSFHRCGSQNGLLKDHFQLHVANQSGIQSFYFHFVIYFITLWLRKEISFCTVNISLL